MPTLFELEGRYLAIYDAIDKSGNEDGELPAELSGNFDGMSIMAALDTLELDNSAKVGNCVAFIHQCEMEAEELKRRASDLAERSRVRFRLAEAQRIRLREYLITTGQEKVTTPRGDTVEILKPIGKPPVELVDGFPLDELPAEYVRVKREPDKVAIGKALASGIELDFARYAEPQKRLRIK